MHLAQRGEYQAAIDRLRNALIELEGEAEDRDYQSVFSCSNSPIIKDISPVTNTTKPIASLTLLVSIQGQVVRRLTPATRRYAGRSIEDGDELELSSMTSTWPSGHQTTDSIGYSYNDLRRRLVETQQAHNWRDGDEPRSKQLTTSLGYSEAGNLACVSTVGIDACGTPTPGVTERTYDRLDRLVALTIEDETTGYRYLNDGRLDDVEYPSGASTKYIYHDQVADSGNVSDRVYEILHSKEEPGSIASFAYDYTKNGQRHHETQLVEGVQVDFDYKYDGIGRLVRSEKSRHGVVTQTDYSFDARYERQAEEVRTDGVLTANKSYLYNNARQLRSVDDSVSGDRIEFKHDRNGNLVSRRKIGSSPSADSLHYDGLDRLVRVERDGSELGTYAYDSQGLRIREWHAAALGPNAPPALAKQRFYFGGRVSEEFDLDAGGEDPVRFRWVGGALHSTEVEDERRYIHRDLIGNTVAVTSTFGEVTESFATDPFGKVERVKVESGGPSKNVMRHTYTGHVQDQATGLVYMRARYYDPEVGLFLSQDPAAGRLGDPRSRHAYQYAHGDPVGNTDPSGRSTVFLDQHESGNVSGGVALPSLFAPASTVFGADYDARVERKVQHLFDSYRRADEMAYRAARVELIEDAFAQFGLPGAEYAGAIEQTARAVQMFSETLAEGKGKVYGDIKKAALAAGLPKVLFEALESQEMQAIMMISGATRNRHTRRRGGSRRADSRSPTTGAPKTSRGATDSAKRGERERAAAGPKSSGNDVRRKLDRDGGGARTRTRPGTTGRPLNSKGNPHRSPKPELRYAIHKGKGKGSVERINGLDNPRKPKGSSNTPAKDTSPDGLKKKDKGVVTPADKDGVGGDKVKKRNESSAADTTGTGCFLAGTMVETYEGPKPIESIRPGDVVWSKDEGSGESSWKRVINRLVTPEREILELVFVDEDENEHVVILTPNHALWSADEEVWKDAVEFILGERVESLNGELTLIDQALLPYGETVYNLEVEGFHSYFVGEAGIWAHNANGVGGGVPCQQASSEKTAQGAPQSSAQAPDSGPTASGVGEDSIGSPAAKGGPPRNPDGTFASVGGPTAGQKVDSGTRKKILERDRNPDGSWACATCGQKTANPANIHTGHIKPRSKGGDLSDANLRCEGAACNLSQGAGPTPKPNRTCAARGSCGAPYGRQD